MNRSFASPEIETVIKNLPTNNSPWSDTFTGEFYKTFREELTPILLKLFQNIAEGRILPNSFYKITITLIPKPEKDIKKKKKKIPGQYHCGEFRCQNPQQNTSKPNPTAL